MTAANFLKYVDGKFYDRGVINRAVRPDNTVRHDVEIPSLDFGGARNADGQGFAVFGRVIAGMDVVKKIQSSPPTRC